MPQLVHSVLPERADICFPTHMLHVADEVAPEADEYVPAAQLMHTEFAVAAEYLPGRQSAQKDCAEVAYVPAPQFTQTDAPADDAVPEAHALHADVPVVPVTLPPQNFPDSHCMHADLDTDENFPVPQTVQIDCRDSPVMLPCAQAVHTVAGALLNVPTEHTAQALPLQYSPTSHCVQVDAPETEYDPDEHCMHDELPADEYWFAAHRGHDDADRAEYLPASQVKQLDGLLPVENVPASHSTHCLFSVKEHPLLTFVPLVHVAQGVHDVTLPVL